MPLSHVNNDAGSLHQPQHSVSSLDQQHVLDSSRVSGSAGLHRSTSGQSSSAVRAWRFPSSRRFLWDRTATGPCIHLHPQVSDDSAHTHACICAPTYLSLSSFAQVFLPTVVVRQQAFLSLQEHEGVRELHLPAEWQTDAKSVMALTIGAGTAPRVISVSIKQLRTLVSNGHGYASGSNNLPHSTFSLSIEQGQRGIHECCFGDSSLQLAQALTAAVKTSLNARSAVSIAQVPADSLEQSAQDSPPCLTSACMAVSSLLLPCAQLPHLNRLCLLNQRQEAVCGGADLCCGLSQHCCAVALSTGHTRSFCPAHASVC